jgi:hypothetical protein
MGKCVLQIKGTKVTFAAVRERYVVCGCVFACMFVHV